MNPFRSAIKRLAILAVTVGCLTVSVSAGGDDIFEKQIRPLVARYCNDCHSGETTEADIDLGAFASPADVRRQLDVWLKVRTMLDSGQMPPPDSLQPTDDERKRLQSWVRGFLAREAEAHAGDPGPVVLRRLNNEEYNYSIQDLTGIATLDPTREFPVDGAAGEGFINTGTAQAMSPALVTKYLDAAKEVASHAVLLPDGIAFSAGQSRREWTEERVAAIRRFYSRFTVTSDVRMEVSGAGTVSNEGGAIPLDRYLSATLEEREALSAGRKSVAQVAAERALNAKYLGILWQTLSADPGSPQSPDGQSLLLDPLRSQWRSAGPADVDRLVAWIAGQQQVLFQYNPIGHIGQDGKPKIWMDVATPAAQRRDFSLPMKEQDEGTVSIFLSASDAGDGSKGDLVVWKSPRLTIENGPDILLRDLAGLQDRIEKTQTAALARTTDYLAAIAQLQAANQHLTEELLADTAQQRELELSILKSWASYLGSGPREPVIVAGHFDQTETHGDYGFIRSWGTGATPIVTANSSDNQVRIPGIARPHGITAHPSPTHFAAIGWQSPIDGVVTIEAQLSDAHPECGDGQEWFLQHRTSHRIGNLWKGRFGAGGSAKMQPRQVSVRKGELISFILGPGGEYTCDLTEMNLTITETQGANRKWDLAGDVSGDLLASNPHADRFGHAGVWHFYSGRMETVRRDEGPLVSVPAGSLLHHWQIESDAGKRHEIAKQIEELATGKSPQPADSPDGILYSQLRNLVLSPRSVQALLSEVTPDEKFGKHPLGHEVAASDLVVQAPSIVEFRIPARIAAGRTLVVSGVLDPRAGRDGTVRLDVGSSRPDPAASGSGGPLIVNAGSEAEARVLRSFAEFRALFPPHLCYERIVPVDEVVTLTLFYRQDDALQRLMLDEDQVKTLERMWDELSYVAQEPLRYEVAFEQIREFATQDRPDLVKLWDPLQPQVTARADAFRQRLLDTEPAHLNAVLEFVARAWRRPLADDERLTLSEFYRNLRSGEIAHEDAVRLALARVLTSPAFLYRREVQPDGSQRQPVTDLELATRLSYFLWSSVPDAELRQVAESGRLSSDETLVDQTRRMLNDSRTRRLAIQFACQWLHVRDFDQDDNKNEKLYPEFAAVRGDMYEETVRFFEDMFRNDGSILDMLGADHTFLNETLARHYGIDGIEGPGWRRVDAIRDHGRGGVLGMAALLASQSGASRTSPILRGNWVYETLLGERLPRPPANVPTLPEDVPQGLTARQLIEKHSSDAACAKCHVKIDPFGFALEQYDAIGRLRPANVDTRTKLENGTEIDGLDGLRDYLLTSRRQDIVRQFCRKLLGLALGREVQLSDEPLLDQMVTKLSENHYRFQVAVETIVLSDQFRKIRGAASGLPNP